MSKSCPEDDNQCKDRAGHQRIPLPRVCDNLIKCEVSWANKAIKYQAHISEMVENGISKRSSFEV